MTHAPIRLVPRTEPEPGWTAALYLGAAAIGLLSMTALVLFTDASIPDAIGALISGAVGSRTAILATLVAATPLIFTGLATVIAYRAGVWNIGQEGQVLAGAMAAWQASLFVAGLPPVLAIPICIIAGAAGGALLGGLAGWLRTRFGANEIVSTVMLNYLVAYFLSWLLGSAWAATGDSVNYQQTALLPESLWLPLLGVGGKLHLGFVLGLICALWLSYVLSRTPLGYEIRAMGDNPTALGQRGADTRKVILLVMLMSGGLAAMAGVGEVFGVTHRVTSSNMTGLGFSGIIIAMIGNLTPRGTVLAALFFGGLSSGALFMNVMTGVPAALITAVQGIVLILFLIAGVLSQFRLVRG